MYSICTVITRTMAMGTEWNHLLLFHFLLHFKTAAIEHQSQWMPFWVLGQQGSPTHKAGLFNQVFKNLDFFFLWSFHLLCGISVPKATYDTSSLMGLNISRKDKRRGTMVLGSVSYKEPAQKPPAQLMTPLVSPALNSKDPRKKESWCWIILLVWAPAKDNDLVLCDL